ncbi:probable amino acid permease 7 isoform X2 [Malania oleifera]|uniref:probable amino acid permease 7 isoform X2 n=1 Tax=Malania oleifera TaxID=397392 RepID=UPI0025AEC466|nr:probable amino acid permease 7 isoform X2 [Malania oleifera]
MRRTFLCGFLQYVNLYGTRVVYVITTSTSMRAIQKSNCYHREGHQAPCAYGDSFYMMLFGAIQIVASQIPDFHNMAWLSVVAAMTSFSYSSIGLALAFAKIIENGRIRGALEESQQPQWLKNYGLQSYLHFLPGRAQSYML